MLKSKTYRKGEPVLNGDTVHLEQLEDASDVLGEVVLIYLKGFVFSRERNVNG